MVTKINVNGEKYHVVSNFLHAAIKSKIPVHIEKIQCSEKEKSSNFKEHMKKGIRKASALAVMMKFDQLFMQHNCKGSNT